MNEVKIPVQELGGQRGEGANFRKNTVYVFICGRDLAWQPPSVHAQLPRVRT